MNKLQKLLEVIKCYGGTIIDLEDEVMHLMADIQTVMEDE